MRQPADYEICVSGSCEVWVNASWGEPINLITTPSTEAVNKAVNTEKLHRAQAVVPALSFELFCLSPPIRNT